MKRILFGLLAALMLAGCSSDDAPAFDGQLQEGVYAYYDNNYVVAISPAGKQGWKPSQYFDPGYISILDRHTNAYVFQQTEGVVQGAGSWTYSNGLRLVYTPTSATSFKAVVASPVEGLVLPAEIQFTRNK